MTINEIFSTIRDWAVGKFQPKGNYAESTDVPTKTSQLQNDAGYISTVPEEYVTEEKLADKGYLTEETDPTVPEWAKQSTKPQYTKAEIGLENADDTSDMDKPVSTAQQAAMDGVYQQATGYTDQQIANLINGAPSTLDTLGEIAQAMKDNDDVVGALDQAIGTKASQAEVDGHTGNDTIHITASERQAWNGKQTLTGDTQNNVVTFNSGDTATPTSWADAPVLTSGEKHSSILNKVSTMFRNVRYLWQLIGNDQLSIGDGTITSAINTLNTSLDKVGQQISVGTPAKTIPPQTDVEIGSITLPSGFWIIYISIWYGPYFKSLRINGFQILNEDHKPEMIAFYNGPGATLPLIAYSWEAGNIEIDEGSIMAFRLK